MKEIARREGVGAILDETPFPEVTLPWMTPGSLDWFLNATETRGQATRVRLARLERCLIIEEV